MVWTVVMLGAALLALVAAGALAARGARQRSGAGAFLDRSVVAEAEVVESRAKDVAVSGEPATIYYHLVSWETADGTAVRAETMTGIQPPVPRVGDRVGVRYDPVHPERVVLAEADHAAGAGATSFALARMLVGLGLSLPVAWALIWMIARFAV